MVTAWQGHNAIIYLTRNKDSFGVFVGLIQSLLAIYILFGIIRLFVYLRHELIEAIFHNARWSVTMVWVFMCVYVVASHRGSNILCMIITLRVLNVYGELMKQGPGPRFSNVFFHRNSNSMEISFHSHLDSNTVIATKFCTWHDSCAVVACAKICCDLMASNGITARRIFHRIWIAGKKSLVKRAPGVTTESCTMSADGLVTEGTRESAIM